jgi:GNAT superfamily N-acetyltransferase
MARRGDAEFIKALIAELGYAAADKATVDWIISHPEMEIFIAADPLDKAIGLATLSHRPQLRLGGRIATIDELIVAEAWRGKGVGRELLKRALERAKVLSVKRIEMVNHHGQADLAKAFYEKCGFAAADALVMRFKGG